MVGLVRMPNPVKQKQTGFLSFVRSLFCKFEIRISNDPIFKTKKENPVIQKTELELFNNEGEELCFPSLAACDELHSARAFGQAHDEGSGSKTIESLGGELNPLKLAKLNYLCNL